MTKAEFTAHSILTHDYLEQWLKHYRDHTSLTPGHESIIEAAMEMIDQTNVRLMKKDTDVH